MMERIPGPASCIPCIEKTYGQPVEHWFEIARAAPASTHRELVAPLKAEHVLGHADAIVAHVRALDAACS
jgi:hypothetical protein